MNNVEHIRLQLGLTRYELAQELNCTEGNIGHCECQRIDPRVETAFLLIAYAARNGMYLTLDGIYRKPELTEPQQEV